MLETFLNFFDEYPMPHLETFHFTFACEARDQHGSTVIGTGGQMLESVKRVLSSLEDLKSLTVNELHLEGRDAPGLLDSVVRKCSDSLEYLEIVNVTKDRYPMFYATMFSNLRKLVISPQQLTHDVLMHLLHGTQIEDLVILQNQFTMAPESISHMTWFDVKQIKPGKLFSLSVTFCFCLFVFFFCFFFVFCFDIFNNQYDHRKKTPKGEKKLFYFSNLFYS